MKCRRRFSQEKEECDPLKFITLHILYLFQYLRCKSSLQQSQNHFCGCHYFALGDKNNLATQRPLLCIIQICVSDFWAPMKPQASRNLVFILFKVNVTCLTVGKLSLFCFLGRISHLLSFSALKKIAFKIELVKSTGSLLNNLQNVSLLSRCIFIHSFRTPWQSVQ